jgi:hypothetical protein
MNKPEYRGILVCAFLVTCLLVASGCATVGLDSKPATAATTRITPVQGTSTPSAAVTLAPQTLRTIEPAAATTPLYPVTTPVQGSRYSTTTCAGQGGYVVSPGESCYGEWLDSVETFSCCSAKPVSGITANLSISAVPVDLRVNVADDPGSIVP